MSEEYLPESYPVPECQSADFGMGQLSWRESGEGACIVLLHGISSGSTAWAKQFNDPQLNVHFRLLAWDAPGYGESSDLLSRCPLAEDYAEALHAWLTGLGIQRALLVGHSLGALIASAYAARYPSNISGTILADPAQGYAKASAEKRHEVYRSREEQIQRLGALEYAQQRAAKLLKPSASQADLQQVQHGMSKLRPSGFCRAAWMLANDDIYRYLDRAKTPIEIWCGELDSITPLDTVFELAQHYQTAFFLLPQAGHASYLDASVAFNHRLRHFYHSCCSLAEGA